MCTFSFYPGLLINNKFLFLSLYLLLNPKLEKYKCKYKCMIVVPEYLKVRSCSRGGVDGVGMGGLLVRFPLSFCLPMFLVSGRLDCSLNVGLGLSVVDRMEWSWDFKENKISSFSVTSLIMQCFNDLCYIPGSEKISIPKLSRDSLCGRWHFPKLLSTVISDIHNLALLKTCHLCFKTLIYW